MGADGQVMNCSICGSDTHFCAECPQATSVAGATAFSSYADTGPISDFVSMTSGVPQGTRPGSGSGSADVAPPDPQSSGLDEASGNSLKFLPPRQGTLHRPHHGNLWDPAACPGSADRRQDRLLPISTTWTRAAAATTPPPPLSRLPCRHGIDLSCLRRRQRTCFNRWVPRGTLTRRQERPSRKAACPRGSH